MTWANLMHVNKYNVDPGGWTFSAFGGWFMISRFGQQYGYGVRIGIGRYLFGFWGK